jgi:hypothetical protein
MEGNNKTVNIVIKLEKHIFLIIFSSNVRKICHCTAAFIMLKCHFIVMASNELTSVREVIISAEGVREVIISADERL